MQTPVYEPLRELAPSRDWSTESGAKHSQASDPLQGLACP
jgi:hypothetical protein